MNYKVVYTKSAFKDIKKLDQVAKRKIKNKIEAYLQNPTSNAKRLTNPKIGTYRWRAGNYRIVFDIKNKTVVILRMGHRREIYRH